MRLVQHPQPAKRVLHQIFHNPVRGEQLRGGGNVLRRHLLVLAQPFEHLVLFLRNVELVKPADYLDIGASLDRHHFAKLGQNGGGREQIIRHQQFGEVGDTLEHEGHGAMPVVAGRHQQQAVGFIFRIMARRASVQQRPHHIAGVFGDDGLVEHTGAGIGQNLRAGLPFGGGDHPDPVIVVHIHELQGGEAVEPGVGDLFDNTVLAIGAKLRLKLAHSALALATGQGCPPPERRQAWSG